MSLLKKFRRFPGVVQLIAIGVVSGVVLAAGVLPFVAVTAVVANNEIASPDNLPSFLDGSGLSQQTVVYGMNYQTNQPVELASFYNQNRIDVPFDQISKFAKEAAVATEDPRFYEHGGVDFIGTTRALIINLLHGSTQGGSSITQQYVKNMLLLRCQAIQINKPDQDEKDPEKLATEQKSYQEQLRSYNACIKDASGINLPRKIREMRLAIELNKTLSKDDILRNYLNIVNYGGTIYGIEAASRYYFSVPAKDLSLSQAATLIGIVNSPSVLRIDRPNNRNNGAANGYKLALDRRNYVLERMLDDQKITEAQYEEAKKIPIQPKITEFASGCQTAGSAAYFCSYVHALILNSPEFGKNRSDRIFNFTQGGYKIYTSLDVNLQKESAQAMANYVPSSDPRYAVGAAAVTVQPGTGNILAMVQNSKYSQDPDVLTDPNYNAVNLNTDHEYGASNGFQVGSTYKLFTLIAWLRAGHSLRDMINSRYNGNGYRSFNTATFRNSCTDPGTLKPYSGVYRVSNDSGWERGDYTVMYGTQQSINTVYMQMAHQLDLCDIKKAAEELGIRPANTSVHKDLISAPSSVLGVNYISPLRMAEAYATVAAGGRHCFARTITRVVDRNGRDLDVPGPNCSQAIKPEINAAVATALKAVITRGTGSPGNPRDGVQHIGKTGTTDNAADSWLVGGSDKAVTAIWTGVTRNRGNFSQYNVSLLGALGRHGFYQVRYYVWRQIMRQADKEYGGDPFKDPLPQYLTPSQSSTADGVPDVYGKSLAEAQAILTQAGYVPVIGGQINSQLPTGVAAGTSPEANTNLARGSRVTILVSDGQGRTSATPTVAQMTLPNVIGLSESEALSRLSGLSVKLVEQKVESPDLYNRVITMSPGAGSPVTAGASVTITIGRSA